MSIEAEPTPEAVSLSVISVMPMGGGDAVPLPGAVGSLLPAVVLRTDGGVMDLLVAGHVVRATAMQGLVVGSRLLLRMRSEVPLRLVLETPPEAPAGPQDPLAAYLAQRGASPTPAQLMAVERLLPELQDPELLRVLPWAVARSLPLTPGALAELATVLPAPELPAAFARLRRALGRNPVPLRPARGQGWGALPVEAGSTEMLAALRLAAAHPGTGHALAVLFMARWLSPPGSWGAWWPVATGPRPGHAEVRWRRSGGQGTGRFAVEVRVRTERLGEVGARVSAPPLAVDLHVERPAVARFLAARAGALRHTLAGPGGVEPPVRIQVGPVPGPDGDGGWERWA